MFNSFSRDDDDDDEGKRTDGRTEDLKKNEQTL